jgi:hypothetical protein
MLKVYQEGEYVGLVEAEDIVLIDCLEKMGYEIEKERKAVK